MFLLGESGSTKTSWIFYNDDKDRIEKETRGLNPFFVKDTDVFFTIRKALSTSIDFSTVPNVYFYGNMSIKLNTVIILSSNFRSTLLVMA